ncbi:DUF2218 domain-containing protein [Aliishimia ponticola]|uniref:DUF2218 domain-containing protein n=1 Tax=Aliishimia ponticola TaxID=2499833 RepID=A0A4V3XKE7_9RHOB|nr:DUF2218 domain-containing protein [Aliishimia ponticola]THH36683.1 DUF2218 domain-containing protein [Aliishimia ponticola]
MPKITGYYRTENASKYLQQLCKHFAHKVETSYDAQKGWVAFDMGKAHLSADAEGLTVTSEISDPAKVPMLHNVIDRHLETFAFREEVKTMDWTAE